MCVCAYIHALKRKIFGKTLDKLLRIKKVEAEDRY